MVNMEPAFQEMLMRAERLKKRPIQVQMDGKDIEIGRLLGDGGTKEVYEAQIDGQWMALGVPNIVNGESKWSRALLEPENTEKARALGFQTNSVCEAKPSTLNGIDIPLIMYTRFEDLPYPVLDGKNKHSSTLKDTTLPDHFTTDSFLEYFEPAFQDLKRLITQIRVNRDSIQFCIINNQPRVFLTDLGDAHFHGMLGGTKTEEVREYVSAALSNFLNGLPREQTDKHKQFFENDYFEDYFNTDPSKKSVSERMYSRLFREVN